LTQETNQAEPQDDETVTATAERPQVEPESAASEPTTAEASDTTQEDHAQAAPVEPAESVADAPAEPADAMAEAPAAEADAPAVITEDASPAPAAEPDEPTPLEPAPATAAAPEDTGNGAEPMTMAELLDQPDVEVKSLKHGDVVEGTVVRIDPDEILVDFGGKSEGVVSNRELIGRRGRCQAGDQGRGRGPRLRPAARVARRTCCPVAAASGLGA